MNFKGEELKFYHCPECGKRRLLWKKDRAPRSELITRTYLGVVIKEWSVICKNCHMKYSRRRKKIEVEHQQQLRNEYRDDTTQAILGDGEKKS